MRLQSTTQQISSSRQVSKQRCVMVVRGAAASPSMGTAAPVAAAAAAAAGAASSAMRRHHQHHQRTRCYAAAAASSSGSSSSPTIISSSRGAALIARSSPSSPSPSASPVAGKPAAAGKTTHTLITGDIGGTNARLGLWRCSAEEQAEVFSETYPTTQFPTFEDCLQAFLDEKDVRGAKVEAAALAVAGAVENNRCPMTNTSWVIDGKVLGAQFGFTTAVLNDFEAVGYGIPALGPKDLVALNDVPKAPRAPKVVMGPGTGLGAAQLFWDGGAGGYTVVPGEGAHATFAPRGWRQMALTAYVTARVGHCEIEEVACGRGLELIYEFLLSDPTFRRPDNKPAVAKMRAPEITAAALEGDPVAGEAVDIFLSIVGAEAGAMALRCLARGGVFIAGGIVPRLLARAQQGGYLLDAFVNRTARDRFQYILQGCPLFVVTNTKVGQLGSREYALRRLLKVGVVERG